MAKRVLIFSGILLVLIGALVWYLGHESTQFTLNPTIVRVGEKVTVDFKHFGQRGDPECLFQNGIEDVINSSQQSVLINVQAIQGKVNPLAGKTGFIDPGEYEQILDGKTYLIETIGRCLPGAKKISFIEQLNKATKRGVAQQLTILPGTPAGQYTVIISGQELALTVIQ